MVRGIALAGIFDRLWYGSRRASVLLMPLSAAIAVLVGLRRVFYRCGIFRSHRVDCLVVVVGNLSVGGTGKTPVVSWLARALHARGIPVGIVCSGYGGSGIETPALVDAASDPAVVGDEAVVLARETGVPVASGRDRVAAARMLLAAAPARVIISDDGMQHSALRRDVEVAVVDGTRGLGNGLCLPFGPLREPPGALKRVDAIVVNGGSWTHAGALHCTMAPVDARQLGTGRCVPVADFAGRSVHAVAAIGNPGRFFDALDGLGIRSVRHAFRDHMPLTADALEFDDDLPILMTAKDAIKCETYAGDNCWAVDAELRFDPGDGEKLTGLIVRRLKERDGDE